MTLRRHHFSLVEAIAYMAIFAVMTSMVARLFYQTTLTQRHHLSAAWSNQQSHRVRDLWQRHTHAGDPSARIVGRDLVISSAAGTHRIQLPSDATVATHSESQDGHPLAVLELTYTIPHYHKTQIRRHRFVAAAPPEEAPHAP